MFEKEPTQAETKPETRLQKLMAGIPRRVLTGLFVFVVGALVITFTLYAPTRQKLNMAVADLNDGDATISEKTDQIATLPDTMNRIVCPCHDLEAATLHRDVFTAMKQSTAPAFDNMRDEP